MIKKLMDIIEIIKMENITEDQYWKLEGKR